MFKWKFRKQWKIKRAIFFLFFLNTIASLLSIHLISFFISHYAMEIVSLQCSNDARLSQKWHFWVFESAFPYMMQVIQLLRFRRRIVVLYQRRVPEVRLISGPKKSFFVKHAIRRDSITFKFCCLCIWSRNHCWFEYNAIMVKICCSWPDLIGWEILGLRRNPIILISISDLF